MYQIRPTVKNGSDLNFLSPKGPVDDKGSGHNLQLKQHDGVIVRHRDQLH